MVQRIVRSISALAITIFAYAFLPQNLFAEPNWCSYSPERVPIFTGFTVIKFAPACEGHDICYFTVGRSKYTCDREFWDRLRDICKDNLDKWYQRLAREECFLYANAYHEGLISGAHNLDRKSYDSAQAESMEVYNRLRREFPQLDPRLVNLRIAQLLSYYNAIGWGTDRSMEQTVTQISEEIRRGQLRYDAEFEMEVFERMLD